MSRDKVIAIDGPAYVGKSLIAKHLAAMTGHTYINTGHMYRTIAKKALDQKIELLDEMAVCMVVAEVSIEFIAGKTMVNGYDWTNELDHTEIVKGASCVAKIAKVREVLTDIQRSYASVKPIIMEGRDIGSTVFPEAEWKFYVTASVEVRAQRIYKMMGEAERATKPSKEALEQKIRDLDEADQNRKIAPLVIAESAVVYDNSESPSAEEDAKILFSYMKDPKSFEEGEVLRYQHGINHRAS